MITADCSTYSSRSPMSLRSSTSRKTDTPISSRQSCRLMVAHWSCPVPLVRVRARAGLRVRVRVRVRLRLRLRVRELPTVHQMWERKRCHLCPFAKSSSGRLPVEMSLK
eukprot:scaffold16686_cov66-Phaeocystis_antarctica.AAC.3